MSKNMNEKELMEESADHLRSLVLKIISAYNKQGWFVCRGCKDDHPMSALNYYHPISENTPFCRPCCGPYCSDCCNIIEEIWREKYGGEIKDWFNKTGATNDK